VRAPCALRRRLPVAGLVVLLGACTLEPAYQRPAPPVAPAYPDGPAYHAASGADAQAGTPAPAASALGWRDFLRDARLQRLVELALANNRDLRIAVLNIASARAQYEITRASLFPVLNLDAAADRGRGVLGQLAFNPSTGNVLAVYPSASWELDLFGRNRSLSHAAMDQYLATAQARKAAQMLLVAEVANQYLGLLAADEALEVSADSRRIAEESFRLTQLQFDNGTGSELALRAAEGALEQARAQYAAEQRARAQAQNALVLLVGAPLPEDLPAGARLGEQDFLADIPAGLPSELLERRPDVAQAEEALRAANADIGAARANFFPSISLSGSAGLVSPVLSRLFSAGNNSWGVSTSAALPLFKGGFNVATLAQSKAQRDIAVAQYEKAVQTAFREVADGLAARATYEDQLQALQREVRAQQRRLELAQLRFKAGVDSYLSLLIAQSDLNNAQLARVSITLERLGNLVTLYKDLGGGWIERSGQAARAADAAP